MIGRFAPSPTGSLHSGSLVSALASWLAARHHHGRWLLRIEDIDPAREQPGAGDEILRQLEDFALVWDGDVRFQSTQLAAYRAHADQLIASGKAFHCACSRQQLAGRAHDGVCRPPAPGQAAAIRLRADDHAAVLQDAIQGLVTPAESAGDIVIWRKENLPAYHLAVVVDDADQQVSDVLRGADLLHATFSQLAVQRALDCASPRYAHVGLALGVDGHKLSKQNLAAPLPRARAAHVLAHALRFLGQPPVDLDTPERMLAQASAQFLFEKLPASNQIWTDYSDGTASPRVR